MKSDINPISPDVALTVTMALKPMTFYMVGADEKLSLIHILVSVV